MSEQEQGPNKIGVIAAIVVAVGFVGYILLRDGNSISGNNDVAEVVHSIGENNVAGTGPIFDEDEQARELIIDKKLQTLETELEAERKDRKALQDTIEKLLLESRQDMQRQLQALSDEVTDYNSKIVEDEYLGSRDSEDIDEELFGNIDGILDEDSKAFTDNTGNYRGDARSSGESPFGEGYIVLNMRVGTSQINGNESVDDSISLSGIPDNIEQSIRNTGNNTADNLAGSTSSNEQPIKTEETVDSLGKEFRNVETYEIPAFSFVKVTTLHGVHCPIGAQSVGQSSGLPARPVVIPIRGIFYGPNGAERDIGTAHLYGFCSGFRTKDEDVGRAEIKIVKMSYWDEEGGSQFLAASGYIVDETYNQEIQGTIDNARLAVLAEQSFAAAMVALNSNLAKEEFTDVATDQGSQSVLTGDATKVAATQGLSAAFTEIAGFYNDQAEAAIDTVKVPGGLALKFVSDLPLKVFKAADPIEKASQEYWDILI